MSTSTHPARGDALVIDATQCIACAACASLAPGLFVVEGGCSRIVRAPRDADERDLADAAVAACPVGAIARVRP